MTEAEVIELVGIHGANAITSFTVFISFTFGFLATAHFVGRSLTSAESIATSLLYFAAAASAATSQALPPNHLCNVGQRAIANRRPNAIK